jgi:chemotaxis protein methyltransferase CheR
VTDREVEQFAAFVASRLGCELEAAAPRMTEALERRAAARGVSPAEYVARLAQWGTADLEALSRELTVGETYFFRHGQQFAALLEHAVPERLAAHGGPIRILSAGCSTGEEPYSIAMAIRDAGFDPALVEIRAIDVNPDALRRAREGTYSAWALRETSELQKRRWFTPQRAGYALAHEIREAVRFEHANLVEEDPWGREHYDIVLCRNVMMYFTREAMARTLARIEQALRPGGFLFVGYAETLQHMAHGLETIQSHGTFYYRRGRAAPRPASTTPWFEQIEQSTARLRELSSATVPAPVAVPRGGHVTDALALIEREQFPEALARIEAADPGDPDAALVRAVLLLQARRADDAKVLCRELIGRGALRPAAHHVLSLCEDLTGDRDAAVASASTATELDPAFALAHLHLGILCRRDGNRDRARLELGHAARLIAHETERRVVLFGGGFKREALAALCRAELTALEVRP